MIEIDNKAIQQYVYFPKNSNVVSEDGFVLVLHSQVTQNDYEFTLLDESRTKNYYKFYLDVSQMNDGEYNYSIKANSDVVATGLIKIGKVTDDIPETVIYTPFSEEQSENEIIQYYPTGNYKYRFQEDKLVNITDNHVEVVTPDSGYTALLKVTINANVPSSGHSEAEIIEAYQSGLTVGYESGETAGAEEQKAKLVELNVNENGSYQRENGYRIVNVNVPTGSTINNQVKLETFSANSQYTVTFDSGYTGLQQVVCQVNVPTSGYSQQDLDIAYNSGETAGYENGYNKGYAAAMLEYESQFFTLTIDVTSTDLSGLIGMDVTLMVGGGYTHQQFNGEPIVFDYMWPGEEYEIIFHDVTGYTKPANVSGITMFGSSRTVVANYVVQ